MILKNLYLLAAICQLIEAAFASFMSQIDLTNITLLTDRATCPHCSLLLCESYCFIIKHGFRGHSDSQQCADENVLVSLIREQILTNITNDACQRSRGHDDDAVCWCRKPGNRSKTEEDQLKDVRIWRYKSVLWQRDQVMGVSSESYSIRPLLFNSLFSLYILYKMSIAERIRNRTSAHANLNTMEVVKQLGAFILLASLVLYVLFGAVCVMYFEYDHHEMTVRKWHLNQAVNRRQQARLISTRIFNDTKNLLIIIDRDQTDRVQGLLVNALKQYEGQLDIHVPIREEWDFLNTLNFLWSRLITLGHGWRQPQTTAGQVFVFFYTVIGVPLFYGTVAVIAHKIMQSTVHMRSIEKKLLVLVLLLAILFYVTWLFAVSFYVNSYALPQSFWQSLTTVMLSSLTVQTPSFNKLPQCATFAVLAGSTVAIVAALFVLFLVAGLYNQSSTENDTINLEEELESKSSVKDDRPKFNVIVDEAGDAKLANVDDN